MNNLLEESIKRGVRGLMLSNGQIIHETDTEIIAHSIMKSVPSANVRSEFLQSTIFDFLPDKEKSPTLHLEKYLESLRWYLEDSNDLTTKDVPAYIRVVLHHIFLLTGHILRQQGSNLDDLLHNMLTYYEAYKIPMHMIPQEVYENNEGEMPLTVPINQVEAIRTELNTTTGERNLISTIQQQEYNKQIQNNGF